MFFTESTTDIGKVFGIDLIMSSEMNAALDNWNNISTGSPPWLNPDDEVITINMAKHIADTRAKLVTLDIGVSVSGEDGGEGNPRVEKLQEIVDELIAKIADKMSDAERMGGIMIKYTGSSWDFVLPGMFGITHKDNNGNINGAIFASYATQGKDLYTRLEYHRFEGDTYVITNKAFLNRSNGFQNTIGGQVPLQSVDVWADLQDEVSIANLEEPLFAYFRLPGANTIDPGSPLGVSAFANALEELRAIDIAFSRKGSEVEDSKHLTFVGQALIRNAQNNDLTLPRFVKGLGMGLDDSETTAIHEHVPTMLTDQRVKDINFNLSLAGVKCGFSEGVFVMDGQTGVITATQVESDDRDTIQTIKADRDALKDAIRKAMVGADALVTLYGLAPLGGYELDFSFGDITYNYEEDKASWKSYVMQGWVPRWVYFVKFEGYSEQDAKAMCEEASASEKKEHELFGKEE